MIYTIYRRESLLTPYGLLRGGPWPNGEVVSVHSTKWGARRSARRDAERTVRHGDTVETLKL